MKLYRRIDDKTYQGAPARDVTEDELSRLSPRARRVITQSGSWEAQTVRKDDDAAVAATEAAVLTPAALEAEANAEVTSGKTGKKG